MAVTQAVNQRDIDRLEKQLRDEGLPAIGEIYKDLLRRGYAYAGWGLGVATGDTITGNGALDFMQERAKQNGITLTQDKIDHIRHDMALGYLEALRDPVIAANDVKYLDMRDFHKTVFEANGLDISYWTLYEPMTLIEKYAHIQTSDGKAISGKEIVENLWEELRETEGTGVSGCYDSLSLYYIADDISNGYLYINKHTGKPIDSIKLNSSITGLILEKTVYKKIDITSADDIQAAKKWIDSTQRWDAYNAWRDENANDANHNGHFVHKPYASAIDNLTGSYFSNSKNTQEAEKRRNHNWITSGGKSVTKWIIGAVKQANIINPTDKQIQSINIDNYSDKALSFIFDPYVGHFQEISGIQGTREFKYQLTFIDESPDQMLAQLKAWEQQGNTAMVSRYLDALAQLNPVVILNPDTKPQNKTIADVGEDWIRIRTWLVMEVKMSASVDHNNDIYQLVSDGTGNKNFEKSDIEKRPQYQQLLSAVKKIRQQFGLDMDGTVIFQDDQYGHHFVSGDNKNKPAHQVRILSDKTNGKVSGGVLSDVIIGGKGNDSIDGGDGNDYLNGGAGDDELRGGKGNDVLIGGKGSDKYYYNAGDGNDRIIDDDGNGNIYLNNVKGSSIKWLPKEGNIWQSSDGQWRASVNKANGNLVIQSANSQDQLIIENWQEMSGNKLGINLPGYNSKPSKLGRKYEGDWRTLIIREEGYFDLDPQYAGQYYWGWNNRDVAGSGGIIGGIQQAGFEDVIIGSNLAEEISGNGGGDALDGRGGNDLILGGDGQDLLVGGGGSDTIKGGAGDDFILANSTLNIGNRMRPDERWTMPDDGVKLIYAGPNWGVYQKKDKDGMLVTIYHGANEFLNDSVATGGDFLYGGGGNDHILGSNQNDFIEGDSVHYHSDSSASSGQAITYDEGDDVLEGLGGDDYITGGRGNDYINGDGILKPGYLDTVAPENHGNDYLDGGDGDDTVIGYGGDDYILGGDGDDWLYGDQPDYNDAYKNQSGLLAEPFHGSDEIYGGNGSDHIIGGGKADLLHGGSGNDYIWGDDSDKARHAELAGNDQIWGDAGDDYLDGGYGDDWIHGGDDNDHIRGGAGDDVLYGDAGDDIIYGDDTDNIPVAAHGSDNIEGGDGNDQLIGGGKGDWIYGGSGDDVIWGDDSQGGHELNTEMVGDDYLFGGAGKDTIYGGYGRDTIDGGIGDDKLFGGGGQDIIYAGDGNDFVSGDFTNGVGTNIKPTGNEYDDLIYGGKGEDELIGSIGNDVIYGGEDNDKIWGDLSRLPNEHSADQAGNDRLFGEEGDDYIDGGYGQDYIDGGVGNDVIYGGGGDDFISGGDGDDMLSGDDVRSSSDLGTASGNDIIYGGNGNDIIFGGKGDDLLQGDVGEDHIWGGEGNDKLFGCDGNDQLAGGNGSGKGSGNDILIGGDGDDVLYGEDGDDRLEGGAGNDQYLYYANQGVDTIVVGGGQDMVFFEDIDGSRLSYYRDGDDLVILVDGDLHQQVRVERHFLGGEHALYGVVPSSGYLVSADTITHVVAPLPGSMTPPTTPTEPTNPADPNKPDNGIPNIINGTDHNDVLTDTSGDDIMSGGKGDDTYVYTSGADVINETGGHDTLVFSNGITFDQVGNYLMKFGDDLILKVNDSETNTVTLTNFFLGGDNLVENFTFETGGSITAGDIYGAFGLSAPQAEAMSGVNNLINAMSVFGAGSDAIDASTGNGPYITHNQYLTSSSVL